MPATPFPVSDERFTPLVYSSSSSEQPRVAVILGILLISLFAVSFPSVSKRVPFLRIPHLMFFLGKHFGTGAILATAFCHLLPDAFESLSDPGVNDRYNNIGKWTGAIILSSLLSIFLVEYISTSYVDHLHAEPSAPSSPSISRPPSRSKTPSIGVTPPTPHLRENSATPIAVLPKSYSSSSQVASSIVPNPADSENLAATENTPLVRKSKRTKSLCNFDHHSDENLLPLILLNSPRLSRGGLPHSGLLWGRDVACICHRSRVALTQAYEVNHPIIDENARDGDDNDVKPKIGRKRQIVGILILQLGIMIHSLVIGLTLAITSGTEFTSLVTAIIFHQLFEGLSLGIRIASVPPTSLPVDSSWALNWLEPTLSILFAITTPLGMGIGMLVFVHSHSVTSPAQVARMNLMQGLMSGISAGMLIYAATVEMLGGDFVFGDVGGDHGHGHTHDDGDLDEHGHVHEESKLSPGWRKALAVSSLLAGSIAMALIGLGE